MRRRLAGLALLATLGGCFDSHPVTAPVHPAGDPSVGPFDVSFDGDGKLTTKVGTGNAVCYAIALQDDGKIVAAGLAVGALDIDFAVVRYNVDGSVDWTAVTPIGPGNDYGYGVAIQADGRIVVVGFAENGVDKDFALVRYNADGTLDVTFDGDGKLTTAVGAGDDIAWSVAIQDDQKIVVTGESSDDFATLRYNANGSIDWTTITPIGAEDKAYSVALQDDGKIVVAGLSEGTDDDFAVARYLANGTLDATFGTGGIVVTAIGYGDDYGWSIVIQPDGKLVVGGYAYSGGGNDYAIVRYNVDGTLDTTFGVGGRVITSVAGSGLAYSVALTPDGRILLGGAFFDGSHVVVAVLRYMSDGGPDPSFGTDGMATTWFTSNSLNYGYSVKVQPDGKTLLAGYSIDLGRAVFAIARYN